MYYQFAGIILLFALLSTSVNAQNYVKIYAKYKYPDRAYLRYYDGKRYYVTSYKDIRTDSSQYTFEIVNNVQDLSSLQIYISTQHENIIELSKIEISINNNFKEITNANFLKYFHVNPFIKAHKGNSTVVLNTHKFYTKYFPYIYMNDPFLTLISKNDKGKKNIVVLKFDKLLKYCRIFYRPSSTWHQTNFNNSITFYEDNSFCFQYYDYELTKKFIIEVGFANKNEQVNVLDFKVNDRSILKENCLKRNKTGYFLDRFSQTDNIVFINLLINPEIKSIIVFDSLKADSTLALLPQFDNNEESLQPEFMLRYLDSLNVYSESRLIGLNINAKANFSLKSIIVINSNDDYVRMTEKTDINQYFILDNLLLSNKDDHLYFKLIDNQKEGKLLFKYVPFRFFKHSMYIFIIISMTALISVYMLKGILIRFNI